MGERVKLRCAICDDEQHMHDTLQKLMDIYAMKHDIVFEINHMYSAQELLLFEKRIDFLLLDINMPVMDGIDAAQVLNARGVDYKIIMLTGKVERFKEAFKIGAFRFVTKPVSQNELFEAVDDVRARIVGVKKIQVYRYGLPYDIMQRDILYVMADGDVTRIFTKCAEYRSEKSLKEWMNELDGRMFFRCHRSYVINLSKIEQIEKADAIVTTSEKIPIARRRRTDLLNAFIIYDTKRR